jgi:hypothetical protein
LSLRDDELRVLLDEFTHLRAAAELAQAAADQAAEANEQAQTKLTVARQMRDAAAAMMREAVAGGRVTVTRGPEGAVSGIDLKFRSDRAEVVTQAMPMDKGRTLVWLAPSQRLGGGD